MNLKCRPSAFVALGASLALAVSPGLALAQTQFIASGSSLSSTGSTSGSSGLSSSGLSGSGLTGSSTSGSIGSGSGGYGVGGGSGGGGGGGGGSGGANNTSTPNIPTASNIMATTFTNPYSKGLASSYYPNTSTFGAPNTAAGTFGKPVYQQTNTTASSAAQAAAALKGFSTVGQPRSPVYMTGLSRDLPMITHSAADLQTKVRAAIARSSYVSNKQNIAVAVDGSTVLLRGQVATEREYRVAGDLARTEPGVHEVLNELQIVGAK